MPFYARPPSSHPIFKMSTIGRNECSHFLTFFPKQLGIFGPNLTHLLHFPIYARLQNFIKLSATLAKLCNIKCDHPVCISTDGGHFERIMVVALNMASIRQSWR